MTRKALTILAMLVVLLGAVHAHARSEEAIKRNNFGAELMKQGRLDEAIVELEKAVQVDPDYAAAYFNLAYAYERRERVDDAIAQYKKALQLEPGNVFGHNNLGVLLDKKGLYDEAIAVYEKALKIEPSNATVLANLANARKNKAIIEEREARIADARKQVEVSPTDPRAAYNLARVYAALDMKDQAFEWLAKSLQLGFDDIRLVRDDPALAGLKKDPRFTRLLEGR
jgi:tetratricopeptide (TPR) repeat protein